MFLFKLSFGFLLRSLILGEWDRFRYFRSLVVPEGSLTLTGMFLGQFENTNSDTHVNGWCATVTIAKSNQAARLGSYLPARRTAPGALRYCPPRRCFSFRCRQTGAQMSNHLGRAFDLGGGR